MPGGGRHTSRDGAYHQQTATLLVVHLGGGCEAAGSVGLGGWEMSKDGSPRLPIGLY